MIPADLDYAHLRSRIQSAVRPQLGEVEVTEVRPLPGGLSSLTFLASCRGANAPDLVVKVAPPGLEPVRNRDVLRQARLLDALAGMPGVAVPTVNGTDGGNPPLFVMSFVGGESFEPLQNSIDGAPTREVIHAREFAAAHMLAALHAVDRVGVGLGDEPATTPSDELNRWERAFSTVDNTLSAGTAECFAALRAALPSPMKDAVLHGDYRVGNMLCDGTRIAAVIDWEIWSVGDPRIDLAWFLLFGDPRHAAVRPANPDMPSEAELLTMYETAAGSVVADLRWFEALARLKLAATVALIAKNRLKHGPSDATSLRLRREVVPTAIAVARDLLGCS